MKKLLLLLLVIAVYVVHQDYWNWNKTEPLIFGCLPIGLAYHVGYSILCAITMWVLVKTIWPKHLEIEDSNPKSEIQNPNQQ
jgi:hypothetical protein